MVSDFESIFPEQTPDIYGVDRSFVVDALRNEDLSNWAGWLNSCRLKFYNRSCPHCGNVYPAQFKCKLRICPDCGNGVLGVNMVELVPKIEEIIKDAPKGYRLRRMEMGLRPFRELEKKGIDELRDSWNRLRRSKLFSKACNGGIGGGLYSIESKFRFAGDSYVRSKDSSDSKRIDYDGWNIHIHALVFSKFIRQSHLSKAWFNATRGNAFIVHIDEADTAGKGLYEAVKYCFKPMSLKTPENYAKFLKVWKGKPRYHTFGSFRGLGRDKRKGKYVCPLDGKELLLESMSDRYEAEEHFNSFEVPKNRLGIYSGTGYRKPKYEVM